MKTRLKLSECERASLRAATVALLGSRFEHALRAMLERSTPERPRVRYVVKCRGRRRSWEKVYYDVDAARSYARYAVSEWCMPSDVTIIKQKWISF